jgi:hypothetical protein
VPVTALLCEDGLLDADTDIDQKDFARLQPCITDDGVPADPACMD